MQRSLHHRDPDSELYHGLSAEARPALAQMLAAGAPAGSIAVCLTTDPRRAGEMAVEARSFSRWREAGGQGAAEVLHFPEDPPPDIDARRRNDRLGDRLAVLCKLLDPAPGPRLLVATPEALLGRCPERGRLESRRLTLESGRSHPFAQLVERLITGLDYDSEALCEHPGQIATRGGLIDVYPHDADRPYRIDFFGDEIERIVPFDPSTQRTAGDAVEQLTIPGPPDAADDGGSEGHCIAYLGESPITWMLDDPARLVREHPYRFDAAAVGRGVPRTLQQTFEVRKECGDRWIGFCEIDTEPRLFEGAKRRSVRSEAVAHYRIHPETAEVGMDRFESEQSARRKFEDQIAAWAAEGLRPCFAVAGRPETERIRERLTENPRTAALPVCFLEGTLAAGFIYRAPNDLPALLPEDGDASAAGLALITDSEYFGRHRRKLETGRHRARPALSQVDQLLDFTELADGDPLVHLQHGVCLFRGLTSLDIEGGTKEVITVEFAEGMQLHVPLHESHLLTRYVGLTKTAPKLGKIGGAAWDKTRAAAERATLDYAAELLNLHARRSQEGGHAFPPDHPWQQAFEEAFPFNETPDQRRAIEATKADMENTAAMDRLICGDVGFGKTEVALRAALKAVLAGKQAAILVPTTVLCQQHLNTFRERMAELPILIEMVSRFRTAGQNKKILADVAAGKIDIVIGTHRLLSRDVHFPNLGLLVVDEEQRFGVRQKERIKQLRASIDILTLSATPIPRTLYLAMAGARSMSVIETPPVDRRPIETVVKAYSDALVKSAIQAETDRGGQVFYLHNRVATIEGVARRIREMHPRLRVAVGHGQMEEAALEKIMTRFVAGAFDVLVCTTIIESGIDIPNCNTLIIEGADRFGLAQLYQIRGRVGRFKRQAYAYLLLHRHAALVEQAQKRLHALKQHNQLGAGFRIAMRDLELRGAGNLLGAKQSGHIAGVGFELYCQLLKQSVARLKGDPGADRIRAEVKLDFIATGEGGSRSRKTSGTEGFAAIKEAEYKGATPLAEAALPAEYIAEPRLRIDLYRRLALAEDRPAVDSIEAELADRFGPPPLPVSNLIALTRVRIAAEQVGVRRVETEGDRLICHLARRGQSEAFLKNGSRFPRLRARDPLKRLAEIERFLRRKA